MTVSRNRMQWLLSLAVLIVPAFAVGGDSPLDYYAEQEEASAERNAAIMAATTVEELLELGAVPESYKAFLPQLSAEDRAEVVSQVKANLDTRRAVAERVEGERAVVLRESSAEVGYDQSQMQMDGYSAIVEMQRTEGSWQPAGEEYVNLLPGARGSFEMSGAVSGAVELGLVFPYVYYVNDAEIPGIEVKDVLNGKLQQVEHVATLRLLPAGCLAEGSFPVATEDTSQLEAGAAGRAEAVYASFTEGGEDFVNLRQFDRDVSGTFQVTRLDDDRFSAEFEISAANRKAPEERVTVRGSLENVPEACSVEQ